MWICLSYFLRLVLNTLSRLHLHQKSHFLDKQESFHFIIFKKIEPKGVDNFPLPPPVLTYPSVLSSQANLNIYKQVWICEKLILSADGRKFQLNDSGSVQTTRQCEQSPWTRYSRASTSSSSSNSAYGLDLDSPGLPVSWNRSGFTRRLLKLFCDGVSLVWWVLTDSNVSFQTNFGWHSVWETLWK